MTSRDAVIVTIVTEFDVEASRVSDDANLRDDLGATSPDLLELALAIEEQVGIQVPDAALAQFRTVADVVRYVDEHCAK